MLIRLALCTGLIACVAHAQEATEAEARAYVAADRNGDGVLSAPEFRTFMDALAVLGAPAAKRVKFFGIYDMAFGIVDADGDGVVGPRELQNRP